MTEESRLDRFPPPVDSQLPPLRQRLTQERINAYAEASGDHNPIHLDADFARAVGLPSTIAHGLLTLGVAAAQVELWAADTAWAARVSCRFSAPLPSGQLVSGQAHCTAVDGAEATIELEAENEAGERVLTRALVALRPAPGPASD
ncbi:MAG: MaoC family dehydratase [Candidatus Dormibacteria bacterium]